MKNDENNKVNIYELIILSILFSKNSSTEDKIKFICNIFDFDRLNHYSSDIVLIITTLLITSISRLFVINMNKFTNNELLNYMMTLGEHFTTPQKITYNKLYDILLSEDNIKQFFEYITDNIYSENTSRNNIKHLNNKKIKVAMLADVKNMNIYKTLNRIKFDKLNKMKNKMKNKVKDDKIDHQHQQSISEDDKD